MLIKIAINSQSTGKFTTEVINNRPHLVTQMVSVEGDTVMNRLLYPLSDIANSFKQLDALPAPAGHPTVNGENVSAFHPMAINAFHVGAFVRNPRMVGKQVINDLVFDIEVAEKDERGKSAMDRIKNGEAIGVSTGLNASVNNQAGKLGNTEYSGIVSNIKFDHVAILLDDAPAGDTTFTINSEELKICNLAESVNELDSKVRDAVDAKFSTHERHAWVEDILFSPDRVVVHIGDKLMLIPFGYDDSGDVVFTDTGVEVEKKVTFETVSNSSNLINQGVDDMDMLALVLAMIGNSSNSLTMADKEKLLAMSQTDLAMAIHNAAASPAPTVDQAQVVIEAAGMTINSADFDKDKYALFVANADEFTAFIADKAEKRTTIIDRLVENSKMTKEMIEKMDDDAIESLANSLIPVQDYSVQGQSVQNNDRGEVKASVDYS